VQHLIGRHERRPSKAKNVGEIPTSSARLPFDFPVTACKDRGGFPCRQVVARRSSFVACIAGLRATSLWRPSPLQGLAPR
jgi:hypothetical protein